MLIWLALLAIEGEDLLLRKGLDDEGDKCA
jgi:hypothetical protein